MREGQLFLDANRSKVKPFEGAIPFPEIQSVETREKTIFYHRAPIWLGAAGAAVIALIWYPLFFSGSGLGGHY